ncbi:MAG: hypothetical protein ABIP48_05775 [Planctomycetota bacterium]
MPPADAVYYVLDIERRQMPLDEGGTGGDVDALQRLLDEVTTLRQEALSEFTAQPNNQAKRHGG